MTTVRDTSTTLGERVIFRMPSKQLSALRRRVAVDGLTISFVLRRGIEEYMKTPPGKGTSAPLDIPFAGCLKDGCDDSDFRARAADYVQERCK